MHPVSANPVPRQPRGSLILCPVLFAPYKQMTDRIAEWVRAVDGALDESVRLIVTASPAEVPTSLAASPRLHFVGRIGHRGDYAACGPTARPSFSRLAWSRSAGRWPRRA